jgi:hypothetical protein
MRSAVSSLALRRCHNQSSWGSWALRAYGFEPDMLYWTELESVWGSQRRGGLRQVLQNFRVVAEHAFFFSWTPKLALGASGINSVSKWRWRVGEVWFGWLTIGVTVSRDL